MKKHGIFVAAHDGLVSMVTGVGVVVNSFVEAFGEIKSNVFDNTNLELTCLAPYLDSSSEDFNQNITDITKKSCKENNGKLVFIPTFSKGESQRTIWGGPEQWKAASLSVASHLNAIQEDYNQLTLFAHDTIFCSVRKYLPNLDKLKIIWIPHSLGLVFKDEFTDEERIKIEREAIKALTDSKSDIIGHIGEAFGNVLHKDYSVEEDKLMPFINGLYKNSSRFKADKSKRDKDIKDYKIPLDKKIIFSWGRCTYQKGYDLLIPAYKKFLEDNPGHHLILLMPTETSPDEYLNKIKNEVKKLPEESITLIYEFNETLPVSILQHPNLSMVAFPSRFEGAPITALEAMAFTNKNVRFVYSEIPPLKELFDGKKRTTSVELTVDSLYAGMVSASQEDKNIDASESTPDIVDNYVKSFNVVFKE